MKNHVYFNGRIVGDEKARVSIYDRGLNYGDGLFETMKAAGGRVLFPAEHTRRLINGARALGFARSVLAPLEEDLASGVVERLLRKNGLAGGDAYVRVTVTRGPDMGTIAIPKDVTPTTVIVTRAIDTGPIARRQSRGVSAVLWHGALPQVPGVKTLNFMPNILARAEAKRRGALEGIFVDAGGLVLEGTSSNIFIVSDGTVRTPGAVCSLSSKALPGITRATVLKVARRGGIKAVEGNVSAEELLAAEEAFITNSISEVAPLVRVDGSNIGTGRPGPVTRSIQALYRAAVYG